MKQLLNQNGNSIPEYLKYCSIQIPSTLEEYITTINHFGRLIGIFSLVTSLIYEISAVINPMVGSKQLVVNIAYLFNSLILSILIAKTNSNDVSANHHYIHAFYIDNIVRHSIRILDFEETKELLSPLDWEALKIKQLITVVLMFTVIL